MLNVGNIYTPRACLSKKKKKLQEQIPIYLHLFACEKNWPKNENELFQWVQAESSSNGMLHTFAKDNFGVTFT